MGNMNVNSAVHVPTQSEKLSSCVPPNCLTESDVTFASYLHNKNSANNGETTGRSFSRPKITGKDYDADVLNDDRIAEFSREIDEACELMAAILNPKMHDNHEELQGSFMYIDSIEDKAPIPKAQELNGQTQSHEWLSKTGTAEGYGQVYKSEQVDLNGAQPLIDDRQITVSVEVDKETETTLPTKSIGPTKGGELQLVDNSIDTMQITNAEKAFTDEIPVFVTEQLPETLVAGTSYYRQEVQNTQSGNEQRAEIPMTTANDTTAKSSEEAFLKGVSEIVNHISENIWEDITEYEAVKTVQNGQESQGNRESQSEQSLSQMLDEARTYGPVIVDGYAESGIMTSYLPDETNEISLQKLSVQMSSSIIENLEKIINSLKSQEAPDRIETMETGKLPLQTAKTETTEFKITLNPEHLGKVTVKLVTDGVKMSVLIIAANEQVRDLLMARAQSVRVMVELSGVQVERYEVVTAKSETQSVFFTGEAQEDNLDKENGKNHNSSENGKDSENEQGLESEQDDMQISFAELVQTMM